MASEAAVDLSAAADAGSAQTPTPTGEQGKKSDKVKKAAALKGHDGSPSAEDLCPPEASPATCAELRRILEEGRRNSHLIKEGECPYPTKAQCMEAGRAYKKAKKNSHRIDFEGGECPYPDQALCEEIGRQYREQGGR